MFKPTIKHLLSACICLSCVLPVMNAYAVEGETPKVLTLKELISKHSAALGEFNKIQDRRITMKITGMAPFPILTTVESKRPRFIRRDVTIQDQTQINAYDGKDAWKIDPFSTSGLTPVTMMQDELPGILEESLFDGILLDTTQTNIKLEYLGVVDSDTRSAHAIKVQVPMSGTSTLFLDTVTFLEFKRYQTRPVMGKLTELVIYSDDYRRQDGITMPFHMAIGIKGSKPNMHINVDAVKFNAKIPSSRFQKK